jgi:Mg-chelatase subunit ChlD
LPLNVPGDARDEVKVTVTARFEADPLKQTSSGETTVNVVDVTKSVLFLVDTSGSMSGARIKEAKAAIAKVVRDAAIQDQDWEWAILGFGDHRVREIEEFTKNGSRIIESAEKNLGASGDTPLYYAEAKAVEYLVKQGKAQDGLLIILCDGDDNCIGPRHSKMPGGQTAQDKATGSAARQKLLITLKELRLPGLEGRSK